jgi:hypothetical protein
MDHGSVWHTLEVTPSMAAPAAAHVATTERCQQAAFAAGVSQTQQSGKPKRHFSQSECTAVRQHTALTQSSWTLSGWETQFTCGGDATYRAWTGEHQTLRTIPCSLHFARSAYVKPQNPGCRQGWPKRSAPRKSNNAHVGDGHERRNEWYRNVSQVIDILDLGLRSLRAGRGLASRSRTLLRLQGRPGSAHLLCTRVPRGTEQRFGCYQPDLCQLACKG